MVNSITSKYCTTKLERISYWLYFLGQNIFYGLVAVNIQIFYSDVGITAASVAIILLITKVWDAINDPLLGILIDKCRLKKGRFLPWLRIALPIITLSCIILFALPSNANPVLKYFGQLSLMLYGVCLIQLAIFQSLFYLLR